MGFEIELTTTKAQQKANNAGGAENAETKSALLSFGILSEPRKTNRVLEYHCGTIAPKILQ
jgi:hypothetical protein